jgi:hypothetical protein
MAADKYASWICTEILSLDRPGAWRIVSGLSCIIGSCISYVKPAVGNSGEWIIAAVVITSIIALWPTCSSRLVSLKLILS